jgi:S1-C subfamily serine protease
MTDEGREPDASSRPSPRGPVMRYSSPFGRPPTAGPPDSPTAEFETAELPTAEIPSSGPRATTGQTAAAGGTARPSSIRGRFALAGAGLAVLLVAASAAGAVIAHELWTSSNAPLALSGAGIPSAGSSPGVSSPGALSPGGSSSIGGNGGSGIVGGSGTVGGSGSSGGTGSGSANSNGSGGSSIGSSGISVGPHGISFGSAGATGSGGPANANAIAAKVDPGLVDVNTSYSYQGESGAGTGIVVTASGEVLTNNHVVDGATRITATDLGNGKTYNATVVGYDPSHDIAVIQLQGASGLATSTLGNSSALKVRDPVLGIGNAGGIGGTPSTAGGQVTGLNQSITAGDEFGGQTEQLSGMIETNADIQAGDSGGPLVDGQGRVIGMDTAGSSGFSFGFQNSGGAAYAIPIGEVAQTALQIVSGHGSATVHVGPSAFLGVELGSSGPQGFGGFGGAQSGASTTGKGVPVAGVLNGDPAQRAGLTAGDVITSLDGQAVDSDTQLGSLMLSHHPGDKVTLGWTSASGQSETSSITLASGPAS